MSLTNPLIKRLIFAMLSLPLWSASSTALGQTAQATELRELLPTQTLERELTGAETHRYNITLNKDEFFQVRVEQKGVDVSLKLLDASGHVLATMDSPNSKQGPETLSFVAAQSGSFILEVSGLDAKAEKGNYSILRETSRTATAKDRRRVGVERLFVEGLTARNTEGQAETAIAKLEDALKGWRELEDSYLTDLTERQVKAIRLQPKIKAFIAELRVPNSLIAEGDKLKREGKPESMLAAQAKFTEAVEAARKLFKRLDDNDLSDILSKDDRADLKTDARMNEVNALRGISNTYDALKDWRESINYNKQVIAVIREMRQDPEINASKALTSYVPLKANEASALSSIGTTLTSNLDKPQEGLLYDNQALTLWREVQHENEKYRAYAEYQEASTLQTMAQSYLTLDDRNKAIEHFEQALAIFRRLPDQKSLAASILLQLGNVYSRQLDYEKARGAWDEALKIYEELGDKQAQADVLGQIGLIYFSVNDEQKAREYFNRELTILLSDDYLESAMKENSAIPLPDSKAEPTNVRLFYNVSSR
ncbi:MAG TPA: tetratricopeptide repeat protein [Pyrinomonadaceae bacterium]|jgi:tetratricopeptide (TPR) repeat protein